MKFLILALCFAAAFAGRVDHERCGGVGTLHHISIDTCEGAMCNMTPGTPYACEGHMTPSTAARELALKVSARYLGFPITIIDTPLENSGVQPGIPFTVKFTITPNDVLSGNSLPVSAEVRHTDTGLVEACGTVQVHVR